MTLTVPNVVFKTRVRDESIGGDNPFRWQDVSTDDIFKGKKVVVLALPGAFTPTCSSTHLPGFEAKYQDIINQGVDEVYCLSVNDAFTMFQWGKHLGVKQVKMLPDGNGDFTRGMGMKIWALVTVPGVMPCWSMIKASSNYSANRGNPIIARMIPSPSVAPIPCSTF